jgi:beta-hydroxylase
MNMSDAYLDAQDVKEFEFEEPELGYHEWRETFPQLRGVSDAREELLAEMRSADARTWFEWPQAELWKKPGQSWDVLPLIGFGRRMTDNLALFPALSRVLAKLPGLRTAIFSRVGPGTRITPHRGPFALSSHILRCHFGIRAPLGSGTWVRGEFRQQQVGEWIVFDDLCLHSGINEHVSEAKVVLLIDLQRPASARRPSWPAVPFPTGMPPGWEPVLDHVGGVERYDPESL